MDSLARVLVVAGVVLLVLGVLLHALPAIPLLGRLPGDIRIERPGFRLYLPITTCLVISLVLSAASWLISRLR
jgi:hypothetical protein